MGFEVLFFCYLVSALVLQHVNIYKTVGACLIFGLILFWVLDKLTYTF